MKTRMALSEKLVSVPSLICILRKYGFEISQIKKSEKKIIEKNQVVKWAVMLLLQTGCVLAKLASLEWKRQVEVLQR